MKGLVGLLDQEETITDGNEMHLTRQMFGIIYSTDFGDLSFKLGVKLIQG